MSFLFKNVLTLLVEWVAHASSHTCTRLKPLLSLCSSASVTSSITVGIILLPPSHRPWKCVGFPHVWLCWHGNSSGKRYVCIEFFFFFLHPSSKCFTARIAWRHSLPQLTHKGVREPFLFLYVLVVGGAIKRPCSFKRMRVLYTSLESSDLLKYALLLFQKGAEESTFPLFQILQIKCKYKNTSIRLECIFLLQLCPLVVD